MSLFERIEEFTLQEDNFGLFGLQEDLLDDDLDGALGFLNTNVGQDEGLKIQQPLQTSLESLVMPDSFGEDWMETVDLSSLLNGNQDLCHLLNGNQEVPPLIEVSVSAPEPEPEPRKEGLKASAFELLKQLLTCPVSEPLVESPAPEESLPSSPEHQVVDLHFFTTPEADTSNLDLLNGTETVSSNCLEDLIEIKQEFDESVLEIDAVESMVVHDDQEYFAIKSDKTWSPPQSVASLDSFSSQPSSPEQLQTIDSSHLGDLSDSYSQVSENDFEEVQSISRKTKRESKTRATPYDVGTIVVGDKKGRKKVQNKNAATRYRVKKRIEKQSLQEQEAEMSDTNKELREKVESLQREISYMKELMSEIQKAKQKKF